MFQVLSPWTMQFLHGFQNAGWVLKDLTVSRTHRQCVTCGNTQERGLTSVLPVDEGAPPLTIECGKGYIDSAKLRWHRAFHHNVSVPCKVCFSRCFQRDSKTNVSFWVPMRQRVSKWGKTDSSSQNINCVLRLFTEIVCKINSLVLDYTCRARWPEGYGVDQL